VIVFGNDLSATRGVLTGCCEDTGGVSPGLPGQDGYS